MKLYEIKDLYRKFEEMVNEGLIDDDAIVDTLESIDGEFEEKSRQHRLPYKDMVGRGRGY